ncbi:MAG: aminotransferase class I/II-fold pyridoxal phosphate-dependent enzyme [Frankiaceae bacterium]
MAALAAVLDIGDEVIFVSPPWFFYEAMILGAGGRPVRVRMDSDSFDLDLDAVAAAVTGKTRAVVINTPHNPTGRIYPPPTLQQLARLLTAASVRNGRDIYLISDESYSRILFTGSRSGGNVLPAGALPRTRGPRLHPATGTSRRPGPPRPRVRDGRLLSDLPDRDRRHDRAGAAHLRGGHELALSQRGMSS